MDRIVHVVKKLLKILTYSLAVFTPIIVNSKTSEIFEFNKMVFIYLVSGISFSLSLAILFAQRKYYIVKKLNKTKLLFILLGFFLISLFVSFSFSIDKYVSFYGYYGRFNGGVLSYLSYAWLLFLFFWLYTKKELYNFWKFSFFTSLFVSLEAILTKFNFDLLCFLFSGSFSNSCWTEAFKPSERIFGLLGQPNWLAVYLGVNLIFGYFFYLINKGRTRNLYLLAVTLNYIGLVFTRSVSGILASVVALFFLVLFSLLKRREWLQSSLLLFLIFLVVFSTSDYNKFILNRVNKGFSLLVKKEKFVYSQKENKKMASNDFVNLKQEKITDSFKIRLIVWKGTLALWRKFSLFGTGPETFGIAYYFTRPVEHNYTSEWDYLYNKSHNEFLNFLATTGTVGFLTYTFFVMYLLLFSFKKTFFENNELYLIAFLVFVVLNITNFFGFSTSLANTYLFTVAGGTWGALINLKNNAFLRYSLNKLFAAFFVSILTGVFFIIFLTKYYLADLAFAKGKLYEKLEDYYNAVLNYNKAISLFYNPIYADKLAFSSANLYSLSKIYLKDLKESKVNSESIKNLSKYFINKAISDSPYNLQFWKTKAKIAYLFYQATNNEVYLEQAIEDLKKATSFAPTEPSVRYLHLYLRLIKLRNSPKSLTELEKEIDNLLKLKYDYAKVHILKAKLYYLLYGKNKAENYLEEKFKEFSNPELKNAIEKISEL